MTHRRSARTATVAALLLALATFASALTPPEVWLAHAEGDLARFWMKPDLRGVPVGSFPTFVCHDGTPWNPDDPCPSLADAPGWIAGELGRQYLRMVSRQVYTYGVIFHLTGDPEALDLARAGLADVLADALVQRHLDEAPDWQRPAMIAAAADDGSYWLWSNQPDGIGIPWWEWCELDQAAATMALRDPRWIETLERTLPTWFATMVDPWSGAVLSFPGDNQGPRAHHWMNGYHAAEHALVGYITGAALAGESWRLYYAPQSPDHPLRSYFYPARLDRRRADGAVVEAWFSR